MDPDRKEIRHERRPRTSRREPQSPEPRSRSGPRSRRSGPAASGSPRRSTARFPGVVDTAVGYEGGHVDNPTYEQVCTGTTGHAEVVRVTYDPDKVSYDELLDRFWDMHDPTQVNRQGPDVGDQYRTVIFTHTPEQEAAAQASKASRQDAVPRSDRHLDRARDRLLDGRGLPPVLLRAAPLRQRPARVAARALARARCLGRQPERFFPSPGFGRGQSLARRSSAASATVSAIRASRVAGRFAEVTHSRIARRLDGGKAS